MKSLSKGQEILLIVGLDYLWIDEISKRSFKNSKAIANDAGTTDWLHLSVIKTPAGNS